MLRGTKGGSWGPGLWTKSTQFCKILASPLCPGLAVPCPSWTLVVAVEKGLDYTGPGVGAGWALVTTDC